MANKLIVVPKNKVVEKLLDYDMASDDDLLIVNLSKDEFYVLYDSGFFWLINGAANAMIGDYESEWVTDIDGLRRALKAISDYHPKDDGVAAIVELIVQLFLEAIRRETCVCFYF